MSKTLKIPVTSIDQLRLLTSNKRVVLPSVQINANSSQKKEGELVLIQIKDEDRYYDEVNDLFRYSEVCVQINYINEGGCISCINIRHTTTNEMFVSGANLTAEGGLVLNWKVNNE